MDAFIEVQRTTLCPFAAKAAIEHGPHWDHRLTFEDNVKRNAHALRMHLSHARKARLQGFLSQVGGVHSSNFSNDVTVFRKFVLELARNDQSCARSIAEDIETVGWNFVFADEPIFLNLFASTYPEIHSKRIPDDGHLYIFFQPEFTFGQCNINRTKVDLKSSIRVRFAAAGMPYDGATIDTRRKALSFVFPLEHGDPPIKWWVQA